ncbi:hypothetical protein [Cyanobium gracile]|uniref:Uncharacterized protein n=1 Tax=Cyanobium gracile UHCC 0281 TaxID=3110309 RepID=A0ABU5SSM7_9CYAN|nr:hypothetical protein [Cyanobium gracile]MEA5441531.1 hypothetical protein [Cyanobium gracile UHCC 0281]
MRPTTSQTSDSLIGSLCREMGALRQSWRLLNGHLSTCRDAQLHQRLRREAARLQRRRRAIHGLARTMAGLPLRDPLGASFLLELAGRPLPS